MAKTIKSWFVNGDKGWKICFFISQSISVLLLIVSFFLPPKGVIDPSVFAGIGELAFFPTLYSFYQIIRSGKTATLTKGDSTITVGEKNGSPMENL